jgi:hypothetical protein
VKEILAEAQKKLDRAAAREEDLAACEEDASSRLEALEKREAELATAIKEAEHARLEEQTLHRKPHLMFHELASRTTTAICCLRAHDYHPPDNLVDDNPASFLHLFSQII